MPRLYAAPRRLRALPEHERRWRASYALHTKAVHPKAPKPTPRPRLPGPDSAVCDALDELLGGRPELRKGRMFGCPGYFVGTKAVACVFGDALNLTLPADRIDTLVQQPGFRRFQPRGRVMSGWVLIDQERLARPDPDDALIDAAIAYARSKAQRSPKLRRTR